MASREEIQRLRELARKRHQAATRKVSRLKKNDVHVSGTPLDPRRNAADIAKMRSRDLQSYINKLDQFTSRETNWVHGAGKQSLLSSSLYREYKKLESAVNKRNMADYEKIKGTFIPTLNTTVQSFHGELPDHPLMANPASRSPHIPLIRTNKSFPNDKKLKKLIQDMRKRLEPEFGDKVIAREQKSMRKFFKDMRKVDPINETLKDLRKDFWSLTPAQFAFLWNHTNFAEAASMDYEIAKDHLHDKKSLAEKSESFNTQIRHMKNLVGDVKRMQF